MQQAADIRDAVSPDEVLFVVDAMIGQDAVNTAEAFRDGVGFDGVVLSKLDGDARGGAALSIAQVTGKQIMFASNGEKLDDFDAFHPDRMASRILGMGDMLTLIEKAEQTFSQEEAEKMAAKLATGSGKDFTLDDFLAQMEQVRKMGSISKLLGMLPGMGQIKDQINNIDERDVDRTAAIIKSMTPGERAGPDDHQRLAPGPYRQGLRCRGQRGEEPGGAVLRGPQDDVEDGPGRRDAGNARDAGHGWRPRPSEEADQAGQGQAQERQPDEAQGRGAGRGGPPRAGGAGRGVRTAGRQGARTSNCPTSSRSSWADSSSEEPAAGPAAGSSAVLPRVSTP